MTKEELEENVRKIRVELDREREERNFFQLERDKISSFWEVTRRQLEERKADVRNKDREMEEIEERHQVEIKVYKQKVKHLLYEQQNNVTELKAEALSAVKQEQDEQRTREAQMRDEKRALKLELKEFELSHEDILRNLRGAHDREMSRLRAQFERESRELQLKYEKRMRDQREELELRRKV
jgi:growth arrest-specific protein 8